MENNALVTQFVATSTGIPRAKVENTLKLLVEEDCTVPFVARYRKDATGGLDEVQIRDIHQAYTDYLEREKRRAYILESIKSQGKLTPDLEKKILAAKTLIELEDLYAPYKSKKKTKAQIAEERGLKPLAELLLTTNKTLAEFKDWLTGRFVGQHPDITTLEQAIEGAGDILMETFGHDIEIKDRMRHELWDKATLNVEKKKDIEDIKEASKFKDFFEFKEPLHSLKNPKSSHRFLAIRRGMNLKILKMEVQSFVETAEGLIARKYFPNDKKLGFRPELEKFATKAYNLIMHPSLDLEIKTELKKIADEAAIDVFGVNLKNLLLSPYLGAKTVMGVDPGVVSGCKIVVISPTGSLLDDFVIYPHPPKQDIIVSQALIAKAIDKFKIEYIAIGNGTFGRETLEFFHTHIPPVANGEIKATIISEAGASVYSASDVARLEFPEKDVTVRGAVSIARRFQDPLAELVKIEPKSIGVGQYQHDVNQPRLGQALTGVVESCVNYVGVDINTASAPLLSYISGIGPALAEAVVAHRQHKGAFKNRKELLEIPRFGQKVFTQSAGFLRIYKGEQPLDATFVHPERYERLIKWVRDRQKTVKNLVEQPELIQELEKDKELAQEIGELTLVDIAKSLRAPSQDPRTVFKSVEFDKNIKSIKDLTPGSWYVGVVNNITNFGAFVDIGIKESGLVHLSELSDRYVTNALDVIKVGQEVRVRVIDIDFDRNRISLSMKTGERPQQAAPRSEQQRSENRDRPRPQAQMQRQSERHPHGQADRQQQHRQNPRDDKRPQRNQAPPPPPKSKERDTGALKSNPFAALKNFKVN